MQVADSWHLFNDQSPRMRNQSVYDTALVGAAEVRLDVLLDVLPDVLTRVKAACVYDTWTIDDCDLLRVVGHGAFGKVMLVRRKMQQQ